MMGHRQERWAARSVAAVSFLAVIALLLLVLGTRGLRRASLPDPKPARGLAAQVAQDGADLTTRVSEILHRVSQSLTQHPAETVSHLAVVRTHETEVPTDFYGQARSDNHSFQQYAADDDNGKAEIGAAVVVELAPVHYLSCGCCSSHPTDVPLTDDDFSLIMQTPNVRWLRLNRTQVTNAGLKTLARHPELTLLDLRQGQFGDETLKMVGKLRTLRYLDLSQNQITGPGLSHLAGLDQLETLVLEDNPLQADALRFLPPLPSLRQLRMGRSGVSGEGIASLAATPRLELLDFTQCNLDSASFQHLPRLPQLRTVMLDATQLNDVGVSGLAHLPMLESLHLNMCRVTDRGLERLSEARTIQLLALQGNPISNAGLDHLSKLQQLRDLLLQGTAVTGDGLAALADCESLEDLDLLSVWSKPTAISWQTARQLLARLHRLRRVFIQLPAAPRDDASLTFESMPLLNDLWIQLEHDADRLTLRDLPALQALTIQSKDESRFSRVTDDTSVPERSPTFQSILFEDVAELRQCWLPIGSHLSATQPVRVFGRLSLILREDSDWTGLASSFTWNNTLHVRSAHDVAPTRLESLMQCGPDDGDYFELALTLPQWNREHGLAISPHTDRIHSLTIRADRLEGERPLALGAIKQMTRLTIGDAAAEEIVVGHHDLPEDLPAITLVNVDLGRLTFDNAFRPLAVAGARRFDVLRIQNLTSTTPLWLFARPFSVPPGENGPLDSPETVVIEDVQAPLVGFDHRAGVKRVYAVDVPIHDLPDGVIRIDKP